LIEFGKPCILGAQNSDDFMANDVLGARPLDLKTRLDERSIFLRQLVVRTLDGGKRGHVGSSLSPLEIMRVLYDDILRYRADEPNWEGRDRCILSKGHGCIAQYVMLAEKGFFPHEVLDTFCRRDSILGGHPEAGKVPGVEASTGALGHGLPIGVGRAMGLRIKGSDARVFVVTGDGEINEGSVWEAAMSAAKHRLSSLTIMVDYNKIQSAGPTSEILDLEPLTDKWRAFGFAVEEVDGHDVDALRDVLNRVPLEQDRPTAIICHTVKGKGIGFAENDPSWHHKSTIDSKLIGELYEALGAA
jgi:transketolase